MGRSLQRAIRFDGIRIIPLDCCALRSPTAFFPERTMEGLPTLRPSLCKYTQDQRRINDDDHVERRENRDRVLLNCAWIRKIKCTANNEKPDGTCLKIYTHFELYLFTVRLVIFDHQTFVQETKINATLNMWNKLLANHRSQSQFTVNYVTRQWRRFTDNLPFEDWIRFREWDYYTAIFITLLFTVFYISLFYSLYFISARTRKRKGWNERSGESMFIIYKFFTNMYNVTKGFCDDVHTLNWKVKHKVNAYATIHTDSYSFSRTRGNRRDSCISPMTSRRIVT